jgi:hypothetical protein
LGGVVGRLVGLVRRGVRLGVERNLNVSLRFWSSRIQNNEMDILEVLEESMEVVEMETATCVVTAHFTLAIKYIESIQERTFIAFNKRGHFDGMWIVRG